MVDVDCLPDDSAGEREGFLGAYHGGNVRARRPLSHLLGVRRRLLASLVWTACSTANGKTEDRAAAALAVAVSPVAATEQPIARFIRVTGTLTAEEQADVAAETAGRVVSTPVERGTPVTQGTELVRLSSVETDASVKEAEANAAQIEARLAHRPDGAFDVNKVPEVANARASFALAESEFARIEKLLAERVVSQSEYDQRKTQVEAARQQFESAKNGAEQQYQALQASRARVTLARKAVSDTIVRAPFAGVVVRAHGLDRRLRHARDEGRRRSSASRRCASS